MPKAVSVKLQPTPKIQSAFARKCGTVRGNACRPLRAPADDSRETRSCPAGWWRRVRRAIPRAASANPRRARSEFPAPRRSRDSSPRPAPQPPCARRRVRAVARRNHRLVGPRLRHLLREKIERNFDQRRAAAPVAQARKRAPENIRNLGRGHDRLRRLRHRAHARHRIEIRIDVREPPRVAHGQHQNRHRFAIGLRDAAKRVLRARGRAASRKRRFAARW